MVSEDSWTSGDLREDADEKISNMCPDRFGDVDDSRYESNPGEPDCSSVLPPAWIRGHCYRQWSGQRRPPPRMESGKVPSSALPSRLLRPPAAQRQYCAWSVAHWHDANCVRPAGELPARPGASVQTRGCPPASETTHCDTLHSTTVSHLV